MTLLMKLIKLLSNVFSYLENNKKLLQRNKMRRDQTTMTEDEVGAPLTKKSFSEAIFIYISYFIMIITLPFSLLFVYKVVREYQRAVIFRLGKLRKGRARGPGVFFILPCVDKYINVDLRIETLAIQPQEVLTKDSCTVEVDAVVYYKVFDPLNAIIRVDNFRKASWLLAATTLRNVLGQKTMMEILSERAGLAEVMRTLLDSATYPWGVSIGRVEIKDVRLPPNMQRAMAAEAEATREARAKVIVTEGEMQAAGSMKEAADILGDSPAALQLRYMQTLTSISSEKTSTVVFPFPINLITQ